MFGALKLGFRSMASLILVRNVVGELRPKRTLAASRGFLAAARLSCLYLRGLRRWCGWSNQTLIAWHESCLCRYCDLSRWLWCKVRRHQWTWVEIARYVDNVKLVEVCWSRLRPHQTSTPAVHQVIINSDLTHPLYSYQLPRRQVPSIVRLSVCHIHSTISLLYISHSQ